MRSGLTGVKRTLGMAVAGLAVCAGVVSAADAPEQAGEQAQTQTQAQTQAQLAETERLEQCDRDLCAIALHPREAGAPLRCDLTKTWYKDEIHTAWSKKRVPWPFGDAQCSLKLDVDRALLAGAVTNKKYTLKSPTLPVKCEVDRKGTRYPLAVTLTPEVEFKDGKATLVLLNVEKIKANAVIKSVVWTASKMESSFGVFQKDLLKGINEYITEYCRETYGKPL